VGLVSIDDEKVAFTDTDRDVERQFEQAHASGLVPADIQLAATRTLGQTMGERR